MTNKIIDTTTGEVAEIITTNEDGKLIVAKEIVDEMNRLEREKKEIEAHFKTYREALCDAMIEHGVEKIATDNFTATLVPEHERVTLDSKAVESMYPKVFNDCAKVSTVKASVRVRLK